MWRTEHTELTTASPELVWAVIADVDRWPSWNPGYRAAHLDGPIAAGTVGAVTLANGRQRAFTVIDAKPQASLVLGGGGPGVRMGFHHTIESLPTGGARVSMAATIDGPLTPFLSRLFGKGIAGYYPTAVRQLVAAAEGRAHQ